MGRERTPQPTAEPRVRTGIAGIDELSEGGLPPNSLIVLAGRPGSGKTMFSSIFLHEGALHGEPGLFVSFAESRPQFLSNMTRFGLDFQALTDKGTFEFIDLTTVTADAVPDALELIVDRVSSMKAKRLVIDSFTAIAQAFEKIIDARIALHVIVGKLVRELGCTTLLLVEMPFGAQGIGLGIEEFVADGIIVLGSVPHKGGTQRTISLRKLRGTNISLDSSTYEITPEGLRVFPVINPSQLRGIGTGRLSMHITGFDELTEGGFPERSFSSLVGAAGTGKTTFGLEFIYNGAKEERDKGLFISFGESQEQLEVVAEKLGMNGLRQLVTQGLVTLESIPPETSSIDGHLLHVQRLLEQTGAERVVFDDITAMESICTVDEFYQFVKKLALMVKSRGATALVSVTTAELGGNLITGVRVSTIMDGIILLRYVEVDGAMDRSMIILKMRGTKLDTSIQRFAIDKGGIAMKGDFSGYTGILTGTASRIGTGPGPTNRVTSSKRRAGSGRRKATKRDSRKER